MGSKSPRLTAAVLALATFALALPALAENVAPAAAPAPAAPGAADPRRRPGSDDPPPGPILEPLKPYEPSDFIAIPDRWRILESAGLVKENWLDPYNQNTLKADRPIHDVVPWLGPEWFVNLGLISDTLLEGRRLPVPVGGQSTGNPGQLDVFGRGDQVIFAQTFIAEFSLLMGDTTFKPPEHEFRFIVAGNYNHVTVAERGILNVDPQKGESRDDGYLGIQEMFYDRHLHNVSEFYDFDSLRVGIQTFTSDFRGFLYVDSQPGIRLFGNRFCNRLQYNLAFFRRLEKDTNSGLNTVFDIRKDNVAVANFYLQDFVRKGLTLSGLALYNGNRDRGQHYNENGGLERPAPIGSGKPKSYDVGYFGTGIDGRLWDVNLTSNAFLALGHESHEPLANGPADIRSYLLTTEASMDFDWYRLKLYGLHASGDDDPTDDTAKGFDSVSENPQFAGADTSYWIRQPIPLVGGGGFQLSGRNGLLPALQTSKEEGQSNFVNPGLWMGGVGADFDLYPEVRLVSNISYLAFADPEIFQFLRQQRNVDQSIGWDLSAAVIWRPLLNQNIVLRLSAAVLVPGEGLDDLYGGRYSALYSTLLTAAFVY